MTHWRTNRADFGGVEHLPGSPRAYSTQRDPLPLPSGSLPRSALELSQVSDSTFDERETSASIFFCGFLCLIGAAVVIGYCLLVSFVPQSVQNQHRVEAYRFEGHR